MVGKCQSKGRSRVIDSCVQFLKENDINNTYHMHNKLYLFVIWYFLPLNREILFVAVTNLTVTEVVQNIKIF